MVSRYIRLLKLIEYPCVVVIYADWRLELPIIKI